MDIGLSCITWFLVGYAFAYGGDFRDDFESSIFLGDRYVCGSVYSENEMERTGSAIGTNNETQTERQLDRDVRTCGENYTLIETRTETPHRWNR